MFSRVHCKSLQRGDVSSVPTIPCLEEHTDRMALLMRVNTIVTLPLHLFMIPDTCYQNQLAVPFENGGDQR